MFDTGTGWQPYVGAGVGYLESSDFTGPIKGGADGVGFQGIVGMQVRGDRVGFRLEYLFLDARLIDEEHNRFNASSHGILFGISIYIGRR